jgi:hypothetical protein
MADDVAENGFSEDLNHYYNAWNYWDYLKNDIELQSNLEGILENAFQLVSESTIPIFDEIRNIPGNSDWEAAVELNNSITPLNDVEDMLQETNSIYYNSMNESGKLILSEEDETRLREIAILPGFDYGFGVYNAWKMLDTIINIDLIDDEKFGSISVTNKLILYPNPAGNYFYVGVSLDEKLFNIIVYNIDGRELMTFNDVHEQLPLDITQLPSGVYNVKAKTENNVSYWSKLVIFNPNK